MHCIDCDYDLQHLDTNRCPECGRPFDKEDEKTFRPVPLTGRKRYLKSEIHMTLFIVALFVPLMLPALAFDSIDEFVPWLLFMLVIMAAPMTICAVRIRRAIRGYKDDDV